MGSFFHNAQNITITGSSFNVIETDPQHEPLATLYEHVARNAILNSGGRADEVGCHPGTRKEVINCIEKWRTETQHNATASRIFWLNGPAGAGKTAILQTVAESWISDGILCANFFFFKADSSRNRADPLVSTLLYQLLNFYPAVETGIRKILLEKPRILESSIKEQFDRLICLPFRSIHPSTLQSIVLLIDGLDECDWAETISQRRILHALSALVSQKDSPFLVLIGSRNEHQITIGFRELPSVIESLFLDEKYTPEKDIRLFVLAKFDQIKQSHWLAPRNDNWPSASDVDDIVTKSSGQFLYAATVMHFISVSSANPIISLQRVQGAANFTTHAPFARLDAMYANILSQARDQEALKDILHVAFILRSIGKEFNAMLLRVLTTYNRRYTSNFVHSCISDMTAIARLQQRELVFYHASLVDYLYDQSRSQEYSINLHTFGPKILPALWEHIGKKQAVQFGTEFAPDRLKSMLPDFMNTIVELEQVDFEPFGNLQEMVTVFKAIYNLCIEDNTVAHYKHMIRSWIILYLSNPANSQNEELNGIPESRRYIKMAEIDRTTNIMEPTADDAGVDVLCPSSPFEVHETALWLRGLLHRIHRENYVQDLRCYKHLMMAWISWAISNDIPLGGLDNLPYAREYVWICTAKSFVQAI